MHANAAATIILLLPPLPLLVVTMLVLCLLRRCPSVLRRILLQPAQAFTSPPQNERNHSRPAALTSPDSNVFALVSRTRARRCHHSRRRRLLQVPSQKPSSQPQSTDNFPPSGISAHAFVASLIAKGRCVFNTVYPFFLLLRSLHVSFRVEGDMSVAFPVLAAYVSRPPRRRPPPPSLYHRSFVCVWLGPQSPNNCASQVRAIMHKCCVPPKDIAGFPTVSYSSNPQSTPRIQ